MHVEEICLLLEYLNLAHFQILFANFFFIPFNNFAVKNFVGNNFKKKLPFGFWVWNYKIAKLRQSKEKSSASKFLSPSRFHLAVPKWVWDSNISVSLVKRFSLISNVIWILPLGHESLGVKAEPDSDDSSIKRRHVETSNDFIKETTGGITNDEDWAFREDADRMYKILNVKTSLTSRASFR